MFKVIQMNSVNEPWWFLNGWQNDIVMQQTFATKEQAIAFFYEHCEKLKRDYENMKAKNTFCVAFWNRDDVYYCVECADELQRYIGLMILDTKDQFINEFINA